MKMFRSLFAALALLVSVTVAGNAQGGNLDGCPNAFTGRIVRYYHKTDLISIFNFIPPGGGTIYQPFIVDYGNHTQYYLNSLSVIEPYKQGRAMFFTGAGLSRYVLDAYNAAWRHSWWGGYGSGVKTEWRCTKFLTPSGWMQAMEQQNPYHAFGGKVEFYKLDATPGDGGGWGTGGDGSSCALYVSYDPFTNAITFIQTVCG